MATAWSNKGRNMVEGWSNNNGQPFEHGLMVEGQPPVDDG
jgi:hypothetical protein